MHPSSRTQRCLAVLLLLTIAISSALQPKALAAATATLTIKASPDSAMATQYEVDSGLLTRGIQHAVRRSNADAPVTDAYVTVPDNPQARTYAVDRRGNLYDDLSRELLVLPFAEQSELLRHINHLRAKHYGQFIAWKEASRIIPRKAKFQVKDVESGLTFHVQRRAGSNHADVQPLTKEDTAIMKKIYDGRWSWQRKAILVLTEQGQYAASMHGMPHGGDGIPDNDFSGHFCIHFVGSSTHGSGNVDPEHQLMIYKAAGRLDEYFDQASPYQVVNAFFSAFALKDAQIFRMSFRRPTDRQMDFFVKGNGKIQGILRKPPIEQQDLKDRLLMEIPMEVNIYPEGQRRIKTGYTFRLQRASLIDPWKIESIEMIS
jgi:hypothetical protein